MTRRGLGKRLAVRYLVASGIVANVAAIVILAAVFYQYGDWRVRDLAAELIGVGIAASTDLAGNATIAPTPRDATAAAALADIEPFVVRAPTAVEGFGYGRRIVVGPGERYSRIRDAALDVRDGDIVEITAGVYRGDTAVWTADDVIIRAVGGVARLDAAGVRLPQHKAIWIIQGDNYVVENIGFTHARSRDRNGAGIRSEGANLRVSGCYFRDNENAILAGVVPGSTVIVEHSELARNGHDDGQAHQIYIGRVDTAIFRFNYIHHAHVGSSIKSRAANTLVTYNRIIDGRTGTGNYSIDLSEGGRALVLGNVIQQSPFTNNYHLITFAPERRNRHENVLVVAYNTLVNDRAEGVYVVNHTRTPAHIHHNLMIGPGTAVRGPAMISHNVYAAGAEPHPDDGFARTSEHDGIVSRATLDTRLGQASPAVDAGGALRDAGGFTIVPDLEYEHPLGYRTRRDDGRPDAGAHELDSS